MTTGPRVMAIPVFAVIEWGDTHSIVELDLTGDIVTGTAVADFYDLGQAINTCELLTQQARETADLLDDGQG